MRGRGGGEGGGGRERSGGREIERGRQRKMGGNQNQSHLSSLKVFMVAN